MRTRRMRWKTRTVEEGEQCAVGSRDVGEEQLPRWGREGTAWLLVCFVRAQKRSWRRVTWMLAIRLARLKTRVCGAGAVRIRFGLFEGVIYTDLEFEVVS